MSAYFCVCVRFTVILQNESIALLKIKKPLKEPLRSVFVHIQWKSVSFKTTYLLPLYGQKCFSKYLTLYSTVESHTGLKQHEGEKIMTEF